MLPALARKLIYPLHERFLQRPTFDYLASLEESQWLSRRDLERLQAQKLKALLQSAVTHSPWHARRIREAGIDVNQDAMLTLADLQRLPTMNKQDAMANVDEIAWRGVPGGAFKYNTGGSSGQPLIFYYGRRRQASDAAGRIRARRWWGVNVGDKEVYLWGAPVELSKTDRMKTIRDRLLNQLVLNAFEMSSASMDEYVVAIQAYRPKCIYGYATSIALLAAHVRERGMKFRLPELRVVATTGEPLYPHQRQLIQEVFGVPVANEFGSRDIGFTAHETPSGQMLLLSESILLEILDERGSAVDIGQTGEAVLTALCSDAQPFIRYRTGDIVRRCDETCKEGRSLHVIGEVMGRSTDFIVRADGTVMHALAVIYAVRTVEGVQEFKFIQHGVMDIEILIVPSPRWKEISELAIVRGVQARLGDTVRVNIRLLEAIPAEKSGKHRYVVSHVPLPAGLGQLRSLANENQEESRRV